MSGFLPKPISALLVAVMIINSVLFAAIVAPQPARAIPVEILANADPIHIQQFLYQTVDFYANKARDAKDTAYQAGVTLRGIWDMLKSPKGIITQIAKQLAIISAHVALTKFTNDVVSWINGGGKGKIRVLQDPGKFITDVLDGAGGVLAGAILNVDSRTLCNADFLKLKLKIAFTGPYAVPTFDEKIGCTFSGMADGLRRFQDNFEDGGWTAFVKYSEKPNNRIGQTLIAAQEYERIVAKKGEEARAELGISKGFLSLKKCVVTQSPQGINAPEQQIGKDIESVFFQFGGAGYNNVTNSPAPTCRNPDGSLVPPGGPIPLNAICVTPEGPEQRSQTWSNIEEFKGWWIQQGGMIECKVTTPSEQISDIASVTLEAPIRMLEGIRNNLLDSMGPNVSFLKPYILAVSNAALNQLLKSEKGLVAATFKRPQKPRRTQRQVTSSLQENAQLGASATALSSSVNDFRSFLLNALISFNIYATSASVTTEQADATLGRISIDEPNYDRTSCIVPTETNPAPTDPVSGRVVTSRDILTDPNSCFIDNRYLWRSDGRGLYDAGFNAVAGNFGWPSVDRGSGEIGMGDPSQPYRIEYQRDDPTKIILERASCTAGSTCWDGSICPATDGPFTRAGRCPHNAYTISPGKMFKEEAAWCGAYFEEIPAPLACTPGASCDATTICPASGFCPSPTEPYTLSREIATVAPRAVCVDANAGLVYEVSGTGDANIYLAGTSPSPGNEFFHNCIESGHGDPGPRSGSGIGRVLAYSFNWNDVSPGVSSMTFTASNDTCTVTATTTSPTATSPTATDTRFVGSGCGGGSGSADVSLGLTVTENISGTKTTETILERYFSPTFEGGTVTLFNNKQTFTSGSATTPLDVNSNDAVLLRGNFFPELVEKMREVMEKSYVISGYHYPATTTKDYLSPLADQLGATPDDDPVDNNPNNANYNDRESTSITKEGCYWPNMWMPDTTLSNGGRCYIEGYKGSVADVMTKYNDLNQTYQALFAGLQDENSLEGVDKDLKILTPEENNIRFSLIGQRCPAQPPSANSNPELQQKCPVLTSGEYNMARKFVFEPDQPSGITTGFATNPFTQEQSSSLAGFLNLEDMATQLGTLPPNKNIIKLIRARQLLEQLQVGTPRPLPVPGKPGIVLTPQALSGVDVVRVDLPGYERIQDWLNDTTTRNKHVQELIAAYNYTSAEEAYPQISQELDDILDEITNQITDKLKDVFLKRTERALEEARVNAQERLTRFIEYTRDLNGDLKIEIPNTLSASSIKNRVRVSVGEVTANNLISGIADKADVLKLNAKNLSLFDRDWNATTTDTIINNLLGPSGLSNADKIGLLGSATYKIRTLARFIGIDTNSERFLGLISRYNTGIGTTGAGVTDNLNLRVKQALRDIYLFYTGITDLENGAGTGLGCLPADVSRVARCQLTADSTFLIFNDARSKLDELQNNFALMLDEVSEVKQEYQNLLSSVKEQQTAIDDMSADFQVMLDEYDKANRCFGFPTDAANLWRPSSSVNISYSRSAIVYGTLSVFALAAIGATIGSAILPGFGTLIGGVVGFALDIIGVGSYLRRNAKKKAERKAKRALRQVLIDCTQGIDDFNRHLGQFADNFVCGKINKKYEDR